MSPTAMDGSAKYRLGFVRIRFGEREAGTHRHLVHHVEAPQEGYELGDLPQLAIAPPRRGLYLVFPEKRIKTYQKNE